MLAIFMLWYYEYWQYYMGILEYEVNLFVYKSNCFSNVWETSLGIFYLNDKKSQGVVHTTFNLKFLNLFENINWLGSLTAVLEGRR